MKRTITCIQIQMELTPYNDEGQVLPRPKVEPIVIFEANIPEPVAEWLRSFLPKEA